MLQAKDTDWLNGLKKKKPQQHTIPIYAVYKRPTSHVGTHKNWTQEFGKRHFMQIWLKGKQE